MVIKNLEEGRRNVRNARGRKEGKLLDYKTNCNSALEIDSAK